MILTRMRAILGLSQSIQLIWTYRGVVVGSRILIMIRHLLRVHDSSRPLVLILILILLGVLRLQHSLVMARTLSTDLALMIQSRHLRLSRRTMPAIQSLLSLDKLVFTGAVKNNFVSTTWIRFPLRIARLNLRQPFIASTMLNGVCH